MAALIKTNPTLTSNVLNAVARQGKADETEAGIWLSRFTPNQRMQLLKDDHFAATAVAIILSSIFVVGLLLSVGVVLWGR